MDDFTRKKNKREGIGCDECGDDVPMSFADKARGFAWCRSCGLVVDPMHAMGRGISGLMQWLKFYNVNKSDMQKITKIYTVENLRAARLGSIPIVEEYLKRRLQ